jgi:hypothetical protein
MSSQKSFLPFVFFIFVFLLSGCFEYEENLTIRKDGSGELAVHYAGPEDSDIDVDGIKLSTKNRELREQIERKFNRPGLQVKNFDNRLKGDEQHIYFTVAFDQLTNLAKVRWWDDHQIDAGQRAGHYYWQRTLKHDHDTEENSRFGRWLKEEIAEELSQHIKLRFVIETDGEIIETNARDRTPHRVVWRFDGGDFVNSEVLEMKLAWK